MGDVAYGGAFNRVNQMRQLLSLSKISGMGILSMGRTYWVKGTGETDYPEFIRDIPIERRKTSIASALAACRASSGDHVLVDQAAYAQTDDLAMDLSDVHLLGLARGRFLPTITFTTDKNFIIGNTANVSGCEVGNLRISASGTANISPFEIGQGAFVATDPWIHDCEISTTATTAATADIREVNAVDVLFERCIIGQHASAHPDDCYLQVAGTLGAVRFIDCEFHHVSAAATDQFVTLITGSGATFFRRCMFYNKNATEMTTGVIVPDAIQANFDYCSMFGVETFGTTGKGLVVPSGMGLTVLAADVFNPGVGVDLAEPVASDT